LTLEGIEVKQACDGLEAVDLARKEKFDIVFLDVRMPNMGGLETLKELKILDPGVKCVMITGYEANDLLELAKNEGAIASIQKPLDLGRIDSLLKEYTGLERDKKIEILVVDDDEIVLNFFKMLLKADVYCLTALKTAEEALDSADKKKFDIAFIDIVLKSTSGIDLYLKFREIRPDMKIILITGNPYKCEGVKDISCLYKPFEIDRILWEIDRIRSLKGLNKP
jgi:two-component system response regulator (stage 0 sporulation protein F)